MTSGTVSSLVFLFLSCTQVFAQTGQTQQVSYNQVLNLNGDMQLNSFQFPDRSKVETFSQNQQQIIVNQQTPAIPANQVTGTTGQSFVAISPQSMTISTNGATDLVGGQIEMIMTMQNLQSAAVQPDNTYVAMLSPDRQSWMVQETMRSVNSTDMTVRMVKRTQMDGEYLIVGRQSVETNTLVTPFGSDGSTSVAIQGTGLQENEFQDGFRMSTRSTQPMTMNVDVKDGVDSSMLAALQGQAPVNDYRYSVTTNLAAVVPSLNQQVTVIQMPLNPIRIQKMMQAMGVPPNGQVAVAVAQRGVLQNPGGATGNLGGAAGGSTPGAATQRRGLSRGEFRQEVARQTQQGTSQTQQGTPQAQQGATQNQQGTPQAQQGTPTNGNNPVAAQLLLAPTFTPIQANAVLDQANMRIAIPVRQVDGEFILTMQMMGGAQAAQPAQPAAAEGQRPAAAEPATPAGLTPAGEAPAPKASPAEGGLKPTAEGGKPAAEGGKPAAEGGKPAAEGGKPAAEGAKPALEGSASNSTESASPAKPERRQEKQTSGQDKYGDAKAPQGSIIMTMKEVDSMVAAMTWGGQVAITKMMSDYVMEQTGKGMAPMNSTRTEAAGAGTKIIV